MHTHTRSFLRRLCLYICWSGDLQPRCRTEDGAAQTELLHWLLIRAAALLHMNVEASPAQKNASHILRHWLAECLNLWIP